MHGQGDDADEAALQEEFDATRRALETVDDRIERLEAGGPAGQLAAEVRRYRQEVASTEARLYRLQRERAQEHREALVNSCLIPAVRPYIRGLLEIVVSGERSTRMFSDSRGEVETLSAEELVNRLCQWMNQNGHLFGAETNQGGKE